MGIDSVVACVAEFASFFLVDRVIKWIGHMGIMYLGLLGYAIRFLVYAFLTNPWWVLPADILQGEWGHMALTSCLEVYISMQREARFFLMIFFQTCFYWSLTSLYNEA